MLFSEFQENTGCKDNEHNHKLYKRLEILYMNDDSVTKADVYEMGKKLMDNSKTEEEIKFENGLTCEMNCYKDDIKKYRAEIRQYKALIADEAYKDDKPLIQHWRNCIRWRKEDISRLNHKISGIKFVLGLGGTK